MIWYHAMCLDLLLDATMTVVPYEACRQFYLTEMADLTEKTHPKACARFYANCMLWNMRHGDYEIAEFWKKKLMKEFEVSKANAIIETVTGLRLIESLTLEASRFIGNDTKLQEIENELDNVAKLVKFGVKHAKLFAERAKLHRMHLKMVKKFNEEKFEKLDKLEDGALKSLDYLTADIIKHTKKVWEGRLRMNVMNFWVNHSTQRDPLTIFQLFFSGRVFPFSLPLNYDKNCEHQKKTEN